MAITAYVGEQGMGKTLAIVRRLIKRERQKYRIATNFGYKPDDGYPFPVLPIVSPRDVMELCAAQACDPDPYPLCVAIDEAAALYDCRDARNFPAAMKLLLTHARKLRIELLYAAQDPNDVDVKFQRQCHEVVRCRSFFGERPDGSHSMFAHCYGRDRHTGTKLYRARVYMEAHYVGRTFGTRDQKCNGRDWWPWRDDVAAKYDSWELTHSLAVLMREQFEGLQASPIVSIDVPVTVAQPVASSRRRGR